MDFKTMITLMRIDFATRQGKHMPKRASFIQSVNPIYRQLFALSTRRHSVDHRPDEHTLKHLRKRLKR